MEFPGLEALVAISDAGSLSAAAQATGIPRTTLARRLERLEAELGDVLLSRSETGVAVTPPGELVLEHARPILTAYSQLLETGRQAAGVRAGPTGSDPGGDRT